MRKRFACITAILAVLAASCIFAQAGRAATRVPLSELDLSKMSSGWGEPLVDQSIEGKPMRMGGEEYERGVGTHAGSVLFVKLDGKTERFTALVGVDDETGSRGSVQFRVYGDGEELFDSGVMTGEDPPKRVDVDLTGVKEVMLLVGSAGDGIDFDHADWAEATFHVAGETPKAIDRPRVNEEPYFLTPEPGPAPQINGPRVYGCRPGRPFIYRIPCTGERPIDFSADNLPDSMTLDATKGIIRGNAPDERGDYVVTLRAENEEGKDRREFKIVVGDTLALTPPMGWNHWYTWYDKITAEHIRKAADAVVETGMADYGYQYVNIDDCWMVKPGADDPAIGGKPRTDGGAIRSNKRFPDMARLADYVHSKGLKIGLYTSPGPKTCQRYEGTYKHEKQDAEQFAEWGFDFLKYDWCTYGQVATGEGLERMQRPYRKMGDILKDLDRDIVYNLCQYGMGDVWEWGADVDGNCWRTTGDLGLHGGGRLPGFYHIGMANAQHWEHGEPGHWNDPDYILIGYVGNPRRKNQPPQMTDLTPSEQYSYMSMWSLMAAPLIYSGDITRVDDFTRNVLCNAEVIEVNQDPLGKQARPVVHNEDTLILAKPLSDGSLAVGLFNLMEMRREVSVNWEQLGLEGPQRVRDVWRQEDVGEFDGEYRATVRRHGVKMVRMWPAD